MNGHGEIGWLLLSIGMLIVFINSLFLKYRIDSLLTLLKKLSGLIYLFVCLFYILWFYDRLIWFDGKFIEKKVNLVLFV